MINEALGLNPKMIHGYTADNLYIAFENGEVDGHTIGYQDACAKALLAEKKIARPMIQFGRRDTTSGTGECSDRARACEDAGPARDDRVRGSPSA